VRFHDVRILGKLPIRHVGKEILRKQDTSTMVMGEISSSIQSLRIPLEIPNSRIQIIRILYFNSIQQFLTKSPITHDAFEKRGELNLLIIYSILDSPGDAE
jgi:hypothetical protein